MLPKSLITVLLLTPLTLLASAGDPQLKTDHPCYPGELSCSTFPRLFQTQSTLYKFTTGHDIASDEDKALASWFWRCTHYAHGEEGRSDLFDQGFNKSDTTREYWTGLFAHGFGLCGTTHAQYTAELNSLLGHARSRVAGVPGHNSFEVYLTGGPYAAGRWALLDHDIATVIYTPDGSRLLSIPEIAKDLKNLASPTFKPDRQHGWRIAGLEDSDALGVYSAANSAEYLAGYAGPPPTVHLRQGESLRRYLQPGLDDGQTFVFWGRNYKANNIPGPERSRAFVNQPDKMYNSRSGSGYHPGQVRFANALYTYRPDFTTDAYKEGVVSESNDQVTFEFYTPYIIGATPASDKPWAIYDPGCKNGLTITAQTPVAVSISTDQGKTWSDSPANNSHDLTDLAKGHQQYLLRFNAPAATLKTSNLSWRTVCQCNVAIIPRLHDGTNRITFFASNRAVLSAGPNKDQAAAHIVAGKFDSPTVTLELKAPRNEKPLHLYAASWNNSGNPPSDTKYNIEYSTDLGQSWKPVVKDWQILRRTPEPPDFWSQSFTYGDTPLPTATTPIRIRFTNTGGRSYRKAEAHLVYEIQHPSPTTVTFAWKEGTSPVKTASHTYPAGKEDDTWQLQAGQKVETLWVEYSAK